MHPRSSALAQAERRLAEFVARLRAVLTADAGPRGCDAAADLLAALLADGDVTAALLDDDGPKVRILHHEPGLGFTVFGHVFPGGEHIPPHDHGPTWAIYGQADGVTFLQDWTIIEAATRTRPGRVRPARTRWLAPGEVQVYPRGAVHSLVRYDPTKVIRIEGQPFERSERLRYDPE